MSAGCACSGCARVEHKALSAMEKVTAQLQVMELPRITNADAFMKRFLALPAEIRNDIFEKMLPESDDKNYLMYQPDCIATALDPTATLIAIDAAEEGHTRVRVLLDPGIPLLAQHSQAHQQILRRCVGRFESPSRLRGMAPFHGNTCGHCPRHAAGHWTDGEL